MKQALQFLLARLREPSTWAGMAVAATALHANPDHVSAIAQLGPVVAGLAACFLPEAGQAPQE